MEYTKMIREDEIIPFFDILKANAIRSRTALAVIFLKISIDVSTYFDDISIAHEQFSKFLLLKLRNTDLIFTLVEKLEWGIILTNSGEEEAKALVQRIFQLVQNGETADFVNIKVSLQAMVAKLEMMYLH